MKTLYLITARGGSKGIPGKNIKPLAGKPLIEHTISCALRAGASPDDICVSTDSEEIAAVARNLGLKIPFIRPSELATDSAGSYPVMIHALDFFLNRGVEYDRIILLQPTSPFRLPEDIINAASLWTPETDMVVSVTEAAANPYYDAFETDEDGFLHISKGDGSFTRRQDAPKVWQYNGSVYVISTSSLRKGPFNTFKKIVPYCMPRERSVDLDTPADWMLAEFIFANQLNNLK
ncbi:MAG: acylneuraminate cytidylyltransferase family protein [Bacteroidales bacterium]|nr:acylneuraminate cytidylyltransferase family protein [Bacteroidales bacterium]